MCHTEIAYTVYCGRAMVNGPRLLPLAFSLSWTQDLINIPTVHIWKAVMQPCPHVAYLDTSTGVHLLARIKAEVCTQLLPFNSSVIIQNIYV